MNVRRSDSLSGICGRQAECDKKRRRKRRRRTVCERVRKLKRCTGLWGMLVCGSNEHPELPSCRSTVECVCVCVEAEQRPAAARRPNKCPRRHTNRNTSHSEQNETKGGVLGSPGVRFQSWESGCRLAAQRLEALLETNPLAWTVSKKKQCAVFRPLDKGGWTMLYKKKAMQLAL